MRYMTRTKLLGACALVVALCACTGTPQSVATTAPQNSPSTQPSTSKATRISVPTWHWKKGSPMEPLGAVAKFTAVGRCAVIGSGPGPRLHTIVIWPRGWHGRLLPSGEIAIITATHRVYATTGGKVGLLGYEDAKGWSNSHPCAKKYHHAYFARLKNWMTG
jgi:hypothetical protein